MNTLSNNLHVFVADTCVLIVIAYVLARGPLLTLLFRKDLTRREIVTLGLALGLAGLTEAVFPDARFPFATRTLFVTFAGMAGGLQVGLVTAGVIALGTLLLPVPAVGFGTMLAVFLSAFLGKSVRRLSGLPTRLAGAFLIGATAQACRIVINLLSGRLLYEPKQAHSLWISIPANGFGVLLLVLIVSDAQIRAESERRRMEAERANALASEAQIAALRARLKPHFLFNTLTSISALCTVAPDRAQATIRHLGQLLRRALDTDTVRSVTLAEEIQAVKAYLQIEQERLGKRLCVNWRIEEACLGVMVPPFSLQTLAENAINHGLAPKVGAVSITVAVRRGAQHVVIAVGDTGVGLSTEARCDRTQRTHEARHGLQIVDQQLRLLEGNRSRIRLFSQKEKGTLAAFVLPVPDPLPRRRRP